MSHRPRPILKRDLPSLQTSDLPPFTSCTNLPSHVHFPPTPFMSFVYPAYSPQTYDRAPIQVYPNECRLPRRGERKVLTPSAACFEAERHERSRSKSRKMIARGSYFHPRAPEVCEPESSSRPATPLDTPPLIRDLSPPDHCEAKAVTAPNASLSTSGATSASTPSKSRIYQSFPLDAEDTSKPPLSPRPILIAERKKRCPRIAQTREGQPAECLIFRPELDEGCLGGF